MSFISRKASLNVLLLIGNLILLTIISQIVTADESTLAILEQSTYLYYYESDDQLLDVEETHLYTFAPIPGENITIVAYGLDDTAITSISLYDSSGNLVGTATTNSLAEETRINNGDGEKQQSPFISAIEHTANSSGLYYFEVKNESGKDGLIRTMLFVGEPFNQDITLIDELNPLLPSKAFMVAGDPNREWENELTGETIQGLRTEVDVQPIERIDRAPDVFTSYSTLTILPDVTERLEPTSFARWFNEDEEEIYLVNVRPIPEKPTETSRAILENLDYDTYNSNNFFFFEYFFTVGNGSDPIALDRGAGACAGLADRIDCIASDPNLGRDVASGEVIIAESAAVDFSGEIIISGEQVTVSFTGETCSSFFGSGEVIDIGVGSSVSGTSQVCLPDAYVGNTFIPFDGSSVSGTGVNQQNVCQGTAGNDLLACTTGNDFIDALAGDDAIFASAGNDVVYGNDGVDFIDAGDGDDTVNGGADNDVILGGAGNDILDGGGASNLNTTIFAQQIVFGGTGTDTIIIGDSHMNPASGTAVSQIAGNAYSNSGGNSIADGEQDTYSFEGSPTGEVYLFTDSQDRLDFTNYNNSVNMLGSNYISDTDAVFVIQDGNIPSNISGSNNDDNFDVDSCYLNFTFFSSFINCITQTTPNYTIDGGGGNDTIITGIGNDIVDGEAGDDNISTGAGDDIITDLDDNNTINAGSGNDIVTTGAGNDNIIAGDGDDTVNAGGGNDVIDAGLGTDVIDGEGGTNTLTYETVTTTGVTVNISGSSVVGTGINDTFSNIDNISGTNQDDTFFGDGNNNTFDGLGHINGDTIDYSAETDFVNVNLGSQTGTGTTIGTDTLINIEIINGTEFNDILFGSTDINTINGNGGDDLINDGDGNDTVNAGAGNDTVQGSAGNDTLDGGAGSDDLLDLSAATDTVTVYLDFFGINQSTSTEFGTDTLSNFENISGGSGNDFLVGDFGDNDITGGAGNDQIFGIDGNNNLFGEGGQDTLNGGSGIDIISGGDDNDTVNGNNGADIINGDDGDDTLNGGAGADTIDGGTGADTINGNNGNDILSGGIGNDTIDGGNGDDTLSGDDGNDSLDGGAGTDTIDESADGDNLVVTLTDGAGSLVDGLETDTLFNIENVTTGSGDDTFNISDSDNNTIDASGGTDNLTLSGGSGTITVNRTVSNTVTATGTGVGSDTYLNVEIIDIIGSTGDDTIQLTDEEDNTVTGNGGSDTVSVTTNTTSSDTITIDRLVADVTVTGNGIGTDIYQNVSSVNVIGSIVDDTFNITDDQDNVINGNGGNNIVNVSSTAIVGETIVITRSGAGGDGADVTVSSGGIGSDTYIDADQVNIAAGSGDDIFDIFDTFDNTFDGGLGSDTVDYSRTTATLSVTFETLTPTLVSGVGIGRDVLIDIENINTGSGDDIFIIQDENNNNLDAGAGNDTVTTIMENTYSGVITIVRSGNDVTVTGAGYGTDVYQNVEQVNVTSNTGDDIFRPTDDADNVFDAGGGSNDWIDYTFISGTGGVNVNLTTGTATGDGNDTLSNFENISGTIGNDTLTGDTGNNIIRGNDGIDVLSGSDGDDDLDGGDGNDTLNGGNDNDTLTGGAGDDTIDGGAGTDIFDETDATTTMTVNLTGGSGSSSSTGQGNDTLSNIENVNTGSAADTINLQDAVQNIIDTNGGSDVINVTNANTTSTLTVTRSGNDVNLTDGGTGFGNDQYLDVEQVNITGGSSLDNFTINDSNNNIIDGSGGTDSVTYNSANTITVTFNTATNATAVGTDVGTDTLNNIESVTTGTGDDTFVFDANVGTLAIDASTGTNQTYDFNTGADGTISITDSGTTFLDFRDYDDTVSIDLSDNTSQVVNASLTVTLGGTFTNISGSANNDTIDGSTGADTIYGGAGVDTIDGQGGNDNIYGEAGADILDGGADNDTIDGGADNDTIDGGTGNDTLLGGAGVDTIDGGADNDTIDGGAGNDILDGGAGTDLIDESADNDNFTVTLNNANGTIVDVAETDTVSDVEDVNTGAGDDTFIISDSDDNTIDANGGTDTATISGGTGTITINRSGSSVTVSDGSGSGGIGDDEYIDFEFVNVSGSANNDTFVVNDSGDNEFNGLGGTDTINYAVTTPVTVTIVDNQATINTTGIGVDTLYNIENIVTGSGADFFDINGTVNFALNSGSGADTFFFNTSVDGTLTLETSDTAHLDFSTFTSSGITIDLSDGAAQTVATGLDITLTGTFTTISGTTLADTIDGSTSADIIWADAGNDIIDGGAGDDTLFGNAGNDTIDGGANDDTIIGGAGNDTIDGGTGTDTFNEGTSDEDFTVVLDSASGTTSSADEGNDTLTNVENITTGSGDDTFTLSDSGNNTIEAGTGTDVVTILNANDITVVRSGNDVTVTDNATGVGNDQYNAVEQVNISGTAGDDVFQINDQFANVINGQGGANEVDYSLVTAVINVNVLSASTDVTSLAIGTDTLINIQNITTGSGDDTFIIEDNSVNNVLDASGGTDTATFTKTTNVDGTITATEAGSSVTIDLTSGESDTLTNFETIDFVGSDSNDTFVIQDSNDNNVDGGNGNDTYDASFSSNDLTVTTGAAGTSVSGTGIGTDTLTNIENINTGSGDDTFIIDTSLGGTFNFDAGEDNTLGNLFQFTGDGSAVTTVTITASATATDELDFSQFTGGAIDIDLSDTSQQNVDGGNLFITFNDFIDDVTGTDNNDTIEGNNLDNNIDGGDGDDTIEYSAGDDTVDGGAGNDTVDYTNAPDTITATVTSTDITVGISGTTDSQTLTNVEVLNATSGTDTVNINGASSATINTADGDDTITISSATSSTINAGNGTDTVDYSGMSEAVTVDLSANTGSVASSPDDHTLNDVEDVIGSDFDDTIVGNSDDNVIQGGDGADDIEGGDGDDTLEGGSGNDIIKGEAGDDTIDGEDGDDRAYGGDDDDNIRGGNDNDTLFGGNVSGTAITDGSDTIFGEAGDDLIYGGSENLDGTTGSDDVGDFLYGGDDNDTIYGGNQNGDTSGDGDDSGGDTIEGGDGDDTIYGGNNNDGDGSTVAGGAGDDTGTDNIDGGDGNDTIYGGNNNTNQDATGRNVNNNDQGDIIEGGAGDDTIYGGNNNSGVDGSDGDDGDDTITDDANGGDTDVVHGGNNNDGNDGGAAGQREDGTDDIQIDDGDNNDTAYGDNNNSNGGQGDDDGNGSTEITSDAGDTTDEGNQ